MYIWGQNDTQMMMVKKTTIITFLSSRLGGGCVENNAELMVWLLLLLPPTNAAASVNRSSPTLQLNKMLKTINEEANIIWEEVISLSDSLCEGVIQFVVSFTTTSSSLSCFYLTQKLWGFRLQLSGWLNVAGKGKIAIRGCCCHQDPTLSHYNTTKTNKQMRPPYG